MQPIQRGCARRDRESEAFVDGHDGGEFESWPNFVSRVAKGAGCFLQAAGIVAHRDAGTQDVGRFGTLEGVKRNHVHGSGEGRAAAFRGRCIHNFDPRNSVDGELMQADGAAGAGKRGSKIKAADRHRHIVCRHAVERHAEGFASAAKVHRDAGHRF